MLLTTIINLAHVQQKLSRKHKDVLKYDMLPNVLTSPNTFYPKCRLLSINNLYPAEAALTFL